MNQLINHAEFRLIYSDGSKNAVEHLRVSCSLKELQNVVDELKPEDWVITTSLLGFIRVVDSSDLVPGRAAGLTRCKDCKQLTDAGPCPLCGAIVCQLCAEREGSFCCDEEGSAAQ